MKKDSENRELNRIDKKSHRGFGSCPGYKGSITENRNG